MGMRRRPVLSSVIEECTVGKLLLGVHAYAGLCLLHVPAAKFDHLVFFQVAAAYAYDKCLCVGGLRIFERIPIKCIGYALSIIGVEAVRVGRSRK